MLRTFFCVIVSFSLSFSFSFSFLLIMIIITIHIIKMETIFMNTESQRFKLDLADKFNLKNLKTKNGFS